MISQRSYIIIIIITRIFKNNIGIIRIMTCNVIPYLKNEKKNINDY